ncbi:MAG: pyridoxal phosphate-dependent aminotransferase [Chloroflexi bacterium]|nr:pyridoxal phosphate-dependent aminotransferase [Chloroflexota bacterium]
MNYNFDTEIERRGTGSAKWEFIHEGDLFIQTDRTDRKYGDERLLPLWVADMDFRSPPAVVEALTERAKHGIFGYTSPTDSYTTAVTNWMQKRYNWRVEREWLLQTPGVVPAINLLIQTFVQPGEKVLIQRPVYYPFMNAIKNNGAEIVSNSLRCEGGRYQMDFDDLAEKTADPAVKLAILCSPHNPVSRVWTREELIRFGEICIQNDVLIISDEIHCDLVFNGAEFTAFATISDEFAQNSIICTAPSKTFNLAGLKTSNIIIPNPASRAPFAARLEAAGIHGLNCFGAVAVEAAYNQGEEWLASMLAYVEANYQFMVDYLAEHLPQVTVIPLEGTYLAWCDFRQLGLCPTERKELIMEKANVYLDEGEMFGPEGEGFERINLACPGSLLAEALERIVTVMK